MPAPLLTFDESAHIYRLDGIEVPSVTQVLSPYDGLEFADRRALEMARDRGTRVHQVCEFHDSGRLGTCPPDIAGYLEAWREALKQTKLVPIAAELRVCSGKFRYAGTLDRLMRHPRHGTVLVDIKTGMSAPMTVGWQTAAYLRAYNEMRGANLYRRACILLRPDGQFRYIPLDALDDWPLFLSALNLWRKVKR